jgi:hypothetical protein
LVYVSNVETGLKILKILLDVRNFERPVLCKEINVKLRAVSDLNEIGVSDLF